MVRMMSHLSIFTGPFPSLLTNLGIYSFVNGNKRLISLRLSLPGFIHQGHRLLSHCVVHLCVWRSSGVCCSSYAQ